jgi:hypothetical protein
MTKDLEKKLFEKYPELFKHKSDIKTSLLGFGFECDDGWFPIIHLLCEFLHRRYQHWSKETQESFYVVQVKEKFGGLRFYMSTMPEFPPDALWKRVVWKVSRILAKLRLYKWSTKLYFYSQQGHSEDWGPIFDLEMAAESVSYETCEVCGKPGAPNENGWIQTLCKEHRKEPA